MLREVPSEYLTRHEVCKVKSVGPPPDNWPRKWVAYYCRPCNRVISGNGSTVSHHIANCNALAASCARTGKQPMQVLKVLDNECPACYLGFKGSHCGTCGNTKQPELDASGRRQMYGRPAVPAGDFTRSLSESSGIEVGETYEFAVKSDSWAIRDGERERKTTKKTYKARCIDNKGPLVMFANPDDPFGQPLLVHRTSLGDIRKIEDEGVTDWQSPEAVSMCGECGHPDHEGQCYHTERQDVKPYVLTCQCGAPEKSDVDALREAFYNLLK